MPQIYVIKSGRHEIVIGIDGFLNEMTEGVDSQNSQEVLDYRSSREGVAGANYSFFPIPSKIFLSSSVFTSFLSF